MEWISIFWHCDCLMPDVSFESLKRRMTMATLLKMSAALLLAIGFAGCASAPTNHPCASCSSGVASVKKGTETHAYCVVNGKQVDCTKNPAECPSCAKGK